MQKGSDTWQGLLHMSLDWHLNAEQRLLKWALMELYGMRAGLIHSVAWHASYQLIAPYNLEDALLRSIHWQTEMASGVEKLLQVQEPPQQGMLPALQPHK